MPADPRVIADLESASIEYEEMACDPELADTAAFCEAYGIPLEKSANAILVASRKPEGHHAVCVVLATSRLDVNGVVRRRLGVRKVSFASAELTRDLTGQEIGGVTIFGLPEGVPVWIDSGVLDNDWVVVGAGSRSAKIRFDPNQLVGLDGYEIVEDLAKQPESV
ncbi:MAG: YbaK/EbsC family protein [Acidimicrobiia bacterium]|jgi:prolyl-tRNA editing enzyme YbaK/EbsC (Cys-tRNA(Pro) deacylase)